MVRRRCFGASLALSKQDHLIIGLRRGSEEVFQAHLDMRLSLEAHENEAIRLVMAGACHGGRKVEIAGSRPVAAPFGAFDLVLLAATWHL